MAFHDAHNFSMLQKPNLHRHHDFFENTFDNFSDEVTYWTTQIEVRHVQRLRPISTILTLTPEIRQQIHSYINKIRDTLTPMELSQQKKEAIFSKLNALADEIDRDRTKAEALMSLTLEIASTGGQAAKELQPLKATVESISNLLGKAKEMMEKTPRLLTGGLRPRITGPAQQPEMPKQEDFSQDLDDAIPF